LKLQSLKSITFAYDSREDRILAALNHGRPEAWSVWLTRRMVVALLERGDGFLATTSNLVKRVATEARGEIAQFEREAAIANTVAAMKPTPPDVLKTNAPRAELVQRLTFMQQGEGFRVEFRGEEGGGVDGALTRPEFQRILQMLKAEATKAGWIAVAAAPQPEPPSSETGPKPYRH
jgi:hypothetical protein